MNSLSSTTIHLFLILIFALANAKQAFAENLPPEIASINPTFGLTTGGTEVTIAGYGFTTTSTVNFGGIKCGVKFLNNTNIVATTPPMSAGLVNVVVTNPDGQSATLSNAFNFVAKPDLGAVGFADGQIQFLVRAESNGVFGLEISTNLIDWVGVTNGVGSGVDQILRWPLNLNSQYFRLNGAPSQENITYLNTSESLSLSIQSTNADLAEYSFHKNTDGSLQSLAYCREKNHIGTDTEVFFDEMQRPRVLTLDGKVTFSFGWNNATSGIVSMSFDGVPASVTLPVLYPTVAGGSAPATSGKKRETIFPKASDEADVWVTIIQDCVGNPFDGEVSVRVQGAFGGSTVIAEEVGPNLFHAKVGGQSTDSSETCKAIAQALPKTCSAIESLNSTLKLPLPTDIPSICTIAATFAADNPWLAALPGTQQALLAIAAACSAKVLNFAASICDGTLCEKLDHLADIGNSLGGDFVQLSIGVRGEGVLLNFNYNRRFSDISMNYPISVPNLSFSIHSPKQLLKVGESVALEAVPACADKSVVAEWSSSDPSIASVDAITGVVTAKAFGAVLINAQSGQGELAVVRSIAISVLPTFVGDYDLTAIGPSGIETGLMTVMADGVTLVNGKQTGSVDLDTGAISLSDVSVHSTEDCGTKICVKVISGYLFADKSGKVVGSGTAGKTCNDGTDETGTWTAAKR